MLVTNATGYGSCRTRHKNRFQRTGGFAARN